MRPFRFAHPIVAMTAFALSIWAAEASAQTAANSRITQVKVYPGSATVERVAHVVAGARTLVFDCLPATLDAQSLQVSADASVRVGETSVLVEPRAVSGTCSGHVLDARIRQLEDAKDALAAESESLALVTGYLKGTGSNADDSTGKRTAVDAKNLAAVADALRRTGQDALLRQKQIARKQTELDLQLQPLLADRTRTQGAGNANVAQVRVTLSATADADVTLSYQVAGPGWTPTYRALLDTTTARLRIERQALVAQATGEDWRGIKLLLSTGQPRRATAGRLPQPWRVDIEPPVAQERLARSAYAPAAPAAAAAPAFMQQAPLFDVSVFNSGFTTEFSVPQTIDVRSDGQRVSLMLGQHDDSAAMAVRTSPALDPTAFLIAEIAPPPGVWPAGPMQLYRDGAYVGTGQWTASAEPRVTLSFGRDDLVLVRAEPMQDNLGSGGFIGGRTERRIQRAWTVENRHRTSIAVQVLEAAPVSVDEQVRVTTLFTPQPAELAWDKQPGVALWRFDVDAGKTARITADYTISHPKESQLQMR